jgi:acetyl esterase/lipase
MPRVEVRAAGGDEAIGWLLVGEPFEVHVFGVEAGAEVTVRGRWPGYESYGVFAADEDGHVDASTQAPIMGTYDEADADGLVWSMASIDPDAVDYANLTLAFDAEVGGTVVASASLERSWKAEGVTEIAIDDPNIVGFYFAPPGPGPHPAMLVFGGSEGGTSYASRRAPHLASLGYATLGIGYFAAPGLPATLQDVPLEYFGDAIDWLAARPEVDPQRIGVMGGSRGGELALLLAATFPQIAAVVALVPSGVRWPGWTSLGQFTTAFTYDGMPIPFLNGDGMSQQITGPGGEKLWASTPAFLEILAEATPAELDAATTLAELSTGPVLMLGGGDDQLWPSCPLAQIAMDRLIASGHAAANADELVCYPDAGHFATTTPGFPTADAYKGFHPQFMFWMALGGTPKGIAHAQRASHAHILAFLAAEL